MIKAEKIKEDETVIALYEKGNEILGKLGYTDHSMGHAALVAQNAGRILTQVGANAHTIELARMAGYLHDIGNAINRQHHAEYGALLARQILMQYDLPVKDVIAVTAAIANHDETTGTAYDEISSALILADKADVRRNRVRTKDPSQFDIHDRVNYAVTGSNLVVDTEKKKITLNLAIDEHICSMFDYFEIFLDRMMMCRRAAETLGYSFRLKANGQKVL